MVSKRYKAWRHTHPQIFNQDTFLGRCGTLESAPDYGSGDIGAFHGSAREFATEIRHRTKYDGSIAVKDFDTGDMAVIEIFAGDET